MRSVAEYSPICSVLENSGRIRLDRFKVTSIGVLLNSQSSILLFTVRLFLLFSIARAELMRGGWVIADNFKQAGDQAENFDIRSVFDDSLLQARPMDAVTLVENHDTQVSWKRTKRYASSDLELTRFLLVSFTRSDSKPLLALPFSCSRH